jgi:hypothetical protein
MNGRLRLPPLTAFAHLANLTIKERKGKKGKEIQCNTATTTKTKIRYLLPVERKRKKNKSVSILASRIETLLFYTTKRKNN